MTVIKKEVVVPYPVTKMYELVNEVEKYPEFLSWCTAAKIQTKSPYKMIASIQGNKAGIAFVFTMVNSLQPNQLITIHLDRTGPFRRLEAYWRFSSLEQGSRLGFELQYEFTNVLMGWTLTPLIKNEVNKMLNDFAERAKGIFGSHPTTAR